jgi:hypothetical protein
VTDLNSPADRDNAHDNQSFKCLFQIKSQRKHGGGFSFQGDKPMPLALPTSILYGFAGGQYGIDAIADGLNRSLKPLEIPLWLEFDDTPAIATAVPLQRYDGFDTVKTGIYESMPPQTWIVTIGAMIRPGPGEILKQKKNKIDIDRNGDYHKIPFWGSLC